MLGYKAMKFIKYLLRVAVNQIAWLIVRTVNWEYVEREARRMAEKEEESGE